jgi:hypothetical protein
MNLNTISTNPNQNMNYNTILPSTVRWTPDVIAQKEQELFRSINENLNKYSGNTRLLNEANLDSFNINLSNIEKLFTPSTSMAKTQKSLDQLYALSSNLSSSFKEIPIDLNTANLYLSTHGISLAKTEKEIMDLSAFVQTQYDLTSDMKKAPVSEKFSFNDPHKFFAGVQVNSIRSGINRNGVSRGRKGTNFYNQMSKMIFEESSQLGQKREGEDYLPMILTTERPGKGKFGQYVGSTTQTKTLHYPTKFSEQNSNLTSPKRNLENINLRLKSITKTPTTNLIENNLRKVNPLTNITEDESLLNIFDIYFESLKPYFYYKMKAQILPEFSGLLFSQNEIRQFNEGKSIFSKSNFIPVSLAINDLTSNFEKMREYSSRKSLFELLKHQIDPTNYISNKVLTVNLLLKNSLIFYQKEFMKKILSQSEDSRYNRLDYINLSCFDYNAKIKCIEDFVKRVKYEKFISDSANSNLMMEKLQSWGVIFYLLRCGLEEDLMKYLQSKKGENSEIDIFFDYYKSFTKGDEIDEHIYTQMLEVVKTKSDMDLNPFRHAVFILMTQVNVAVKENLLDSLEDYIWFHLNLIIHKPNLENIKKKTNAKFLTLKEFQDFIKRNGPESFESNSGNIHLEWVRCLFSILLFEDGVAYLSNQNENLVDSVNLGFLLREISLLNNFTQNNYVENVIDRNLQGQSNDLDYKLNKINEIFYENFMQSRLFQILNYVKFNYHGDFIERMAQLISTTGKLNILLSGEYYFTISNKKIFLYDLLTEKEMNELANILLTSAISSSSESKINFDLFIKIARKFKMYMKLLDLIISDCVEIITAKTPRKIYRAEIHLKPSVVNPSTRPHTDTKYEKSIVQKYSEVFYEIGSNINNYDSKFKLNFQMLRQLETIEEIYDLINRDNLNKAIQMVENNITMIPFKKEKDISPYMNDTYMSLNEGLKKILPDVCYLIFYIYSRKVNELSGATNLRRNE